MILNILRNPKLLPTFDMKRLTIIALSLLLFTFACARERHYVKESRPFSRKLIILPEKNKDHTVRSYVINGKRYYPLPDSEGFVQSGKASWYGKKFHGRPTASGELFDMYKKSAAHKTLPLGTYVEVVNISNKKQIVLRINDRGPFVKGRVIDLSYAAAKEIDLVGPGVIDVRIEALGKQVGKLRSPQGIKPVVEIKDLNSGEFTIQVGAFKNKKNALALADRLKVIFRYVEVALYYDECRETICRVRVSKSKTLSNALKIKEKLEDMGFDGAFVVSL